MTAQALNITTPKTGIDIAKLFDKDIETVQRQYRRTYSDTLPKGDITDTHFLNVCKCYPEHPLSISIIGQSSGQSDKTNRQTNGQLYAMRTDTNNTGPTGNLVDLLADRQADTTPQIGFSNKKELDEQKAHYEALIDNYRSELRKSTIERNELSDRQNQVIRQLQSEADTLRHTLQTLQTEADTLNQTITDIEAQRQTAQTEADTLRQTLQTIEADKQTEINALQQTVQALQTQLTAAKASFNFKFKNLLNAELEAINVLSISFAIYGFYVLFNIVGLFTAGVMALFLKNTIKNMKSKKDMVVAFGMRVAIFIEVVFGLFHFTTFYNLLLPIEAKLILPYAGFFALLMASIFSGLSIASLRQQNNQVK